MTQIAPFRAVIYNPQKIKDLTEVVCPPYDIISSARQEYYHQLNPYNYIHILLGRDIPGEDKYCRAKNYFNHWLKEKIFIQEEKPAVYFYSQQFSLKGEKKTRLGFIALLRLEDKRASIFGHESTRVEPKEDRLKLIKQVKASLSPIFAVFSDRKRIIQRTYEHYLQDKSPLMDIIDGEKTEHKLWRLDSPEIISSIQSAMQEENIFIADGHHRYEVACAYREEMKKSGLYSEDAPFNYILSYFTNTESQGLVILPIHRLLKLDKGIDLDDFKSRLKGYFDVEEIKDKTKFFFLMQKAGNAEHVIGMYKNKNFWLLRLKNIKILDKMISDKPRICRFLDISILNHIILKAIFNIELEDKERITFSAQPDELIQQVDSHDSYAAFFLNPVKIRQIMQIALEGEKMPAKSTYFYPKVLSGLVINKHEEKL